VKTASSEVVCDQCRDIIPAFKPDGSQNMAPIFVTLRGPGIGHRKFDLCGGVCFTRWAMYFDPSKKISA